MLDINNNARRQLIKRLMEEEGVEKGMVEIYRSLLDMGAADCFVLKWQKEKFLMNVKVLYGDSLRHQRQIFNLIEKYKDQ